MTSIEFGIKDPVDAESPIAVKLPQKLPDFISPFELPGEPEVSLDDLKKMGKDLTAQFPPPEPNTMPLPETLPHPEMLTRDQYLKEIGQRRIRQAKKFVERDIIINRGGGNEFSLILVNQKNAKLDALKSTMSPLELKVLSDELSVAEADQVNAICRAKANLLRTEFPNGQPADVVTLYGLTSEVLKKMTLEEAFAWIEQKKRELALDTSESGVARLETFNQTISDQSADPGRFDASSVVYRDYEDYQKVFRQASEMSAQRYQINSLSDGTHSVAAAPMMIL